MDGVKPRILCAERLAGGSGDGYLVCGPLLRGGGEHMVLCTNALEGLYVHTGVLGVTGWWRTLSYSPEGSRKGALIRAHLDD